MTDEPSTLFPEAVDLLLDLMPTGPTWRALFAEEPGLEVAPTGDGWLRVLHRGTEVCQLEQQLLDPQIAAGRARFLIDSQPVELYLGRKDQP